MFNINWTALNKKVPIFLKTLIVIIGFAVRAWQFGADCIHQLQCTENMYVVNISCLFSHAKRENM